MRLGRFFFHCHSFSLLNLSYCNGAHTSLHTSMVPNTTCRPSKKLSPMMMTVAPPVVHPSLGLIALMHGVAAYPRQREEQIQHLSLNAQAHVSFHKDTLLHRLYAQLSMSHTQDISWKLPLGKKKMMDLSFKA